MRSYEKSDESRHIPNFFFLLLAGSASASNATDNQTAVAQNITQFNLTLYDQRVTVNITDGFVHIYGNVIDIIWQPPFDVDLGVVRCHFESNPTNKLATSNYVMRCEFDWNTTPEEIYSAIPAAMLKNFAEIQISEKEFAQANAVLVFSVLLNTLLIILLFAYIYYNEIWLLREEG